MERAREEADDRRKSAMWQPRQPRRNKVVRVGCGYVLPARGSRIKGRGLTEVESVLGAVGQQQDDDAARHPDQAGHLERVGTHALGQRGRRVGAHAACLRIAQPKQPRRSLRGKGTNDASVRPTEAPVVG